MVSFLLHPSSKNLVTPLYAHAYSDTQHIHKRAHMSIRSLTTWADSAGQKRGTTVVVARRLYVQTEEARERGKW